MDLPLLMCGSARPEHIKAFDQARAASWSLVISQLATFPQIKESLLDALSREHVALTWSAQALPSNQDNSHTLAAHNSEQRALQRVISSISSSGLSAAPAAPNPYS